MERVAARCARDTCRPRPPLKEVPETDSPLPRCQASLLTQLCTGHAPLNEHLHCIRKAETDRCPSCKKARDVGSCRGHEQAVHNLDAHSKAVSGCTSGTHHTFLFLLFTMSCSLMLCTPICCGPLLDFVSTLFLLCRLCLLFRHVLILAVPCLVTSVL